MALGIETGSLVAGANSYASVEEAVAYATARGLTDFPTEAEEVEPLLIKAMDYLESLAPRYIGRRVSATQALSWPRSEAYQWGDSTLLQASNAIPANIKLAQCRLAFDALTIDLLPSGTVENVVSETVDVISTTYGAGGKPVGTPTHRAADALLEGFLRQSGGLATYRA